MAAPLLGAFLGASVGALAKKVLSALGFGLVTYAGLQAAFAAVQGHVIESYGAMAGNSLIIADLAGVGTAIGILLGALSARVGIAALSHIGRVL